MSLKKAVAGFAILAALGTSPVQASHLFTQGGDSAVLLNAGQQVTATMNGLYTAQNLPIFDLYFDGDFNASVDDILLTVDGVTLTFDEATDWTSTTSSFARTSSTPFPTVGIGSQITLGVTAGSLTWTGLVIRESTGAVGALTDLGPVTLIASVPEPTTLAILGLGLLGMGLRRRKA